MNRNLFAEKHGVLSGSGGELIRGDIEVDNSLSRVDRREDGKKSKIVIENV